MRDTSVSDLDVNREVRKVFVRHRVNLGWLSIRSCRGTVLIHGELQLLPGTASDLTPLTVGVIFQELKRCRGVHRTTIDLQNWLYDSNGDVWRPKTAVVARDSGHEARIDKVFEIHHAQ